MLDCSAGSAIGRIRRFIATFARDCFRRTGAATSKRRVISASGDDGAAAQARLLRAARSVAHIRTLIGMAP